ncbi:hypothetical protein ACWC9T_40095 [Kitasatospora sp. NPDC001159]
MSVGGEPDLAAAVVAALVQAASRTAGAALTAFGPDVERVWQGLRQLPRWEAVAERLAAEPCSEEAQRDVTAAVRELLTIDKTLEAALAARWPAPETEVPAQDGPFTVAVGDHTGIGTGTGQTAVGSHNTVVGRDMKTTHRHGVGGVLVTVVVAAAVVAGVGSYLGLHKAQQSDGPGLGRGTAVLTVDQVKSVLPDLHAVPTGWSVADPPSVSSRPECPPGAPTPDSGEDSCEVRTSGLVVFSATDGAAVRVSVVAGPSTAWADTWYRQFLSGPDVPPHSDISFPALGDASEAVNTKNGTFFVAKIGTTLVTVNYEPLHPRNGWDSSKVIPIARMLTARSQQAQNGEAPTATTTQ